MFVLLQTNQCFYILVRPCFGFDFFTYIEVDIMVTATRTHGYLSYLICYQSSVIMNYLKKKKNTHTQKLTYTIINNSCVYV